MLTLKLQKIKILFFQNLESNVLTIQPNFQFGGFVILQILQLEVGPITISLKVFISRYKNVLKTLTSAPKHASFARNLLVFSHFSINNGKNLHGIELYVCIKYFLISFLIWNYKVVYSKKRLFFHSPCKRSWQRGQANC